MSDNEISNDNDTRRTESAGLSIVAHTPPFGSVVGGVDLARGPDIGVQAQITGREMRANATEAVADERARRCFLVRDHSGAYHLERNGGQRITGGWCDEFVTWTGHSMPAGTRQAIRLHVEVLGEQREFSDPNMQRAAQLSQQLDGTDDGVTLHHESEPLAQLHELRLADLELRLADLEPRTHD